MLHCISMPVKNDIKMAENITEKEMQKVNNLTNKDFLRAVTEQGAARLVEVGVVRDIIFPGGVFNFFQTPNMFSKAVKIATIKQLRQYATDALRVKYVGFGLVAEVDLVVMYRFDVREISCEKLLVKKYANSEAKIIIVNDDIYVTGCYPTDYVPAVCYTISGGAFFTPVVSSPMYDTAALAATQEFSL